MKNFIRHSRNLAPCAAPLIYLVIPAVTLVGVLAACAGRPVTGAPGLLADPSGPSWNRDAKKTMRAFGSEEELKTYVRQLAEKRRQVLRREAAKAAPMTANQAATADAQSTTFAKDEAESITNTQHAGVDEGGIVSCTAIILLS